MISHLGENNMTEKIKIFMVKYDQQGKPVDVAYGNYKSQDVEIFRKDGYVDVEEGLVMKIEEDLIKNLRFPLV